MLSIVKLHHAEGLNLPYYATAQSAGMDLIAAVTEPITIGSGKIVVVPTGIALALPEGFEAQIRPRSGLAANFGITVLNAPGTVDADYRGEIKVILINHGSQSFTVERGARIAQMVLAKYERVVLNEVSSLSDTVRGSNGFGSTGQTS